MVERSIDVNAAWDRAIEDARANVLRGGPFMFSFIGALAGRLRVDRSAAELVNIAKRAETDHAESVRVAVANDERMGRHTP